MNRISKYLSARSAALVTMGLSAATSFAAVDVTPITAVLTDVATVGVAVFGVYVGIKAVKFIRHAL